MQAARPTRRPHRGLGLRGAATLAALAVMMAGCVQSAAVETDTHPPSVRFVLFCAKDRCDTSLDTVDTMSKKVQSWFRDQLDPAHPRTFRRLKTVKVVSDHSVAYFRAGGDAQSSETHHHIYQELKDRKPAVNPDNAKVAPRAYIDGADDTTKTIVVLGFRDGASSSQSNDAGLGNCGVTVSYNSNDPVLGVVDQTVAGKRCTGFATMNAAHELVHTWGIANHVVGDTLMNGAVGTVGHGYACGNHDGTPTSQLRSFNDCNLDRGQAGWLRDNRSGWFTSPSANASGVVLAFAPVDYGVPRWDSPATAAVGFYRYWNQAVGDHYYTIGRDDAALATLGYQYEGCEASVLVTSAPGSVPLRRMWSTTNTDHYYTTDSDVSGAEMLGYQLEPYSTGDVFTSQEPGTVPLYRYWSAVNLDHFYTPVRDDAAYAGRGYYEYEGIAAYVLPAADGCE